MTIKPEDIPDEAVSAGCDRRIIRHTMREIIADALTSITAERDRMREALGKIIELDHHNFAPASRATILARSALAHEEEK